jgi:N-acetylmuramoyl-L-alanine amidase
MTIRGRSCIAAFMACLYALIISTPAYPSYNSDAGRRYTIASQRLTDLRKSTKKKKYRSYWIDCLRTFESVEKKYPKSPAAADACYDRAGLYLEMYQISRFSRDIDSAMQTYGKCESIYPRHAKAPEALYRVIDLSVEYKRNDAAATKAYARLNQNYPDSPWTESARTRLGISVKTVKPEPKAKKPASQGQTASKRQAMGAVTGIRHWSEGAYTRIVIDQSRQLKFQTQVLKDRLVFDLFDARIPKAKQETVPINDGILKQVRSSQHDPTTVRIVLDLASIQNYEAFPLREPDRLVIDVQGENSANGVGVPANNGIASVSSETTGSGTLTSAATKTENAPEPPAIEAMQSKSLMQGYSGVAPSRPNNDGERLTLSRQLGLKVKTIAIDAGHGGHDPGAIGKSGLKEKNITLDIAKRLAILVRDRLGCNVVMTRDKDVFIPLDKRPFIAKSRNADLFVSIHVNATRKRNTKGIETYVQGLKASDREAMATAARENAMSERSLGELDNEVEKMLKDLTKDNKIEESIQLAGTVQASLVDTVKPAQKTVVNHGVKSAFFYVLMNTNMPSILAEVGFISNPDEEKLLRQESYRQSLAEALFQGVKKYVDARSPQMMGI